MLVDRKLLEQTAEELFENAPCGYLSTLADGTVVQVNRTFVDMTGHPREWLLAGRRFAELLSTPGRIYHDTHFGPLLQMQGFVKEVAFDLVRRDGHRLPVLVNAVRRPAAGDAPALTLVTVTDATDRRQYEQELLLARRRAEEATEAQRAARELAEQASRVKDEFLAMVSHELRTPLNAIVGWAQLLLGDDGLTEEQRDGVSIIERNAHVQAKLIEDLLDMGRIMSGKMRLDVQDVSLAGVLEAALDTARPAAAAKGVRLQEVLDPGVTVSGDPGRLQQVFWNLLNNAVKFTPKGGSIRVVMQRVNSHAEVRVTDTGQGMEAGFLAHAFERFRQSESGATQKTKGLGLGLSIAKNIVEMHGGAIRAMSEGTGKGSTFLVDLPVTAVHGRGSPDDGAERAHPRAAVATATAPFEVRGLTLVGVRVLVVDDEADAREVVRRVLASSGAEVATARSSAEALALLDAFKPQVLVSDVGLPGEDGYELIRKVRMLGEEVGRVPAVALTAFARLEDRTRAMLSGFQMHLAKPVDARELVVTVATLAVR
ncbi:MAG TPA: ATP-binding protein [Tepidisphaeraceae bacterium]|nr:ATP-binding protein [Tepidisphaeraceae bacterium]